MINFDKMLSEERDLRLEGDESLRSGIQTVLENLPEEDIEVHTPKPKKRKLK